MQSFGKRHLQVMEKASRRHNFVGEYPQGIERTSCGCIILLGSICKSWEEQVVDAQFQWEASSRYRKCGMQMQNLRREYPQIPERARCRCNLYMIGRLKSICKFKEKQVADALAPKKSICNREHQASADTTVATKSICNSEYQGLADTSATRKVNPSSLHLFQSRYITKQEKDYAIQRIGVGLARRSWAGVHSLFLAWRSSWIK